MKKFLMMGVFVAGAVLAWAGPTVDGVVSQGEYANSKTVLDGHAVVSWAKDDAGLTVAVKVKTEGWVGVGFGADKMSGAFIYMGYVDADGKAVFSEQKGRGHSHAPVDKPAADKSAVTWKNGDTVVEFHIPTAKIPFALGSVPFIVAYSDAADLKTFHGDNADLGTLTIR